ncbi:exopolysaccharide biosynthesis polyprenyl glycosylphosphotransferase [Cyclobacterium sp. SYSU L10401]|uniref:exopolysaccharide biosynthesis polyprenyl glycosylphosphotransferase n=1 Tax=Cyclobacterium sp. SYSU L10401 TaxID=2678657 RepID=UPI0013D3AD40|nr:exopolysaccharide biosynthesis polyprenyl glycosylphosphotransferase [Cyclobacterium sp. SYSU L10401]
MIKSDQKLSLLYKITDIFTLAVVFLSVRKFFVAGPIARDDYQVLGLYLVFWLTIAFVQRLYFIHLHNRHYLRFINYCKSLFIFSALMAMVFLLFNFPVYAREMAFIFLACFSLLGLLNNFLVLNAVKAYRKRGKNLRHIIIVGTGETARKIGNYYTENIDFGHKVKGYIHACPGVAPSDLQVLGNLGHLDDFIRNNKVHELIIAIPHDNVDITKSVIMIADFYGLRVRYLPDYQALIGSSYKFSMYGDNLLLNVRQLSLDQLYLSWLKRTFDILFSLLVLFFLFPLFVALALAIKFESRGPVFYCPKRIGQYGKPFKVYKFRSMFQNDSVNNGIQSTIKNDPRITPLGKILRKYSLDELPQFINVLIGDMSVVGPRPHREFLEGEFQKAINNYKVRHYLKPGITGWAQVNGWRGPTETFEQKKERTLHDLWYLENWSFWLDIKIIFLTLFGKKTHAVAY